MKSSVSGQSSKDINYLLAFVKAKLFNFENLRPAIMHAERLCEMKCYEALSESVIADITYDSNRKFIAERFVNKALLKVKYLKNCIDQNEPVLNEILNKIN